MRFGCVKSLSKSEKNNIFFMGTDDAMKKCIEILKKEKKTSFRRSKVCDKLFIF